MIGKLILLGIVALAQSLPQDEQIAALSTRCPSGEVVSLIANERDCTKYYVCGFGRALQEGICSPGLEFSVELQQCVDPAIAKCNCNPDLATTSAPAPVTSPGPEEEREVIFLPNGCPEDNDVPQLLPHETQCDLYYQCENGNKVLQWCAPGTSYDHEQQTCDHSSNVNCISNGTTITTTTSTTESIIEESREVITLPNGCPADFDVHQLLPHETTCSKFYICVHGEKVVMNCAPGTVFDPQIMNCNHPWEVDCVDVIPESEECVCEENDEDCNENGSTDKSESAENENKESGENNASAEKEESKEESGENNASAENEKSSENNASAEKEDSNENNASAEKEESSEDDKTTEKLESGENNETAEKEDSGEKTESNENGEDCVDSNENEDNNGCNCGPEEVEEVEDLRCKEDCHVAHWAHESDCDKFWKCVGEEKVLGVCSEGLHFNEKTQTCDFICNAGCKRHEVQSTAHHDGLKLFLPWDKVNDLFKDASTLRALSKKNHKKRN